MAPSCIYGRATGPLVELGIQRPMSIHVPLLVKTSIARGQAGIVGAGANIWANVDIDERKSPIGFPSPRRLTNFYTSDGSVHHLIRKYLQRYLDSFNESISRVPAWPTRLLLRFERRASHARFLQAVSEHYEQQRHWHDRANTFHRQGTRRKPAYRLHVYGSQLKVYVGP